MGKNGYQHRAFLPCDHQGWSSSYVDLKAAAKAASKAAYNLAMGGAGGGDGNGGKGTKGKGKGKGDKGADHHDTNKQRRGKGNFIYCGVGGCERYEYTSSMPASQISCKVCHSLYNPLYLSDAQKVFWADAKKISEHNGVAV